MPLRRRSSRASSGPRRRIRKLRLLVLLTVLGFLAVSSFSFGFVTAVAAEVDQKLDPAKQNVDVNGYVYASDGKTILAVLRGEESRVLVEPKDIAPVMKQAIVAVEDRRFFVHRGIDIRGVARAAWADLTNKQILQGGSTITQQYVKNAFVNDERTVARKVREAALAWQLEQQWDKERILAAYLNTVYFGNGAYGVQMASKIYFGHAAAELDLHEAALLAGIPIDPNRYDPLRNPRASRERRQLVLRYMVEQGDITEAQFRAANSAPLPRKQDVTRPGTRTPAAPYFTDYVTDQLVRAYGERGVYGRGYRITTTIDLRLQQMAREAIAKWLDDPEGPQAALVAVDPRDGRVLAMVGGNYRKSQFNLAVQGTRQSGSAFKPFVLAAALEQGISPATTFVSREMTIPLGDRAWVVHNYDDVYLGPITLEAATTHSDNAVYAQLTRLIGPGSVRDTARKLGITSPLKNYFSIGLGAQAANPLEIARAFSAFANGGYRIDTPRFGNEPRAVISILDQEGEPVDAEELRPRPMRKLRPQTATWVNALLQNVVTEGTGRRAALANRPAAGKTGTTENYGDAWFVGYTPQLVVAVWVGYPDTLKPMLTEYRGEAVAGGTYPALIWKSFTERAHRVHAPEVEFFDPPPLPYSSSKLVVNRDGVVQLDNGNCATRVSVVYFENFGPKKRANCLPNEVEVPRVVGKTLDDATERLAAQPLTPKVVYKPAAPRQRIDVVLAQDPREGRRLSSYDEVTLVLAKPVHGVVPDLVGLTLRKAREKLRKGRLKAEIAGFTDGERPGRVVSQAPAGGRAAGRGMTVRLIVAR